MIDMKSQGIVIRNGHVLMVQQSKGWVLPGGIIAYGESPEKACIREVREKTGYHVRIIEFLNDHEVDQFTFLVEIIGGDLHLNSNMTEDQDIISIGWEDIYDVSDVNPHLLPLIDRVKNLVSQ